MIEVGLYVLNMEIFYACLMQVHISKMSEIKIPLWVITPKNTLDSLFQIAHEIFFVVNKKPMYKIKSVGKKEMQ